jgi:hypothetical protein
VTVREKKRLLAVAASFCDRTLTIPSLVTLTIPDRRPLTVSGRDILLTRRGISQDVNKKLDLNVNGFAGVSINERGSL